MKFRDVNLWTLDSKAAKNDIKRPPCRHFDQPYGDGSRPVVVKMFIYVHKFSGDEHP
jgi:hypothetical protein